VVVRPRPCAAALWRIRARARRYLRIDLGNVFVNTIVGVCRRFRTLDPSIDVWLPQTDRQLAQALRSPNSRHERVGRLRPGVTIAQAQAT